MNDEKGRLLEIKERGEASPKLGYILDVINDKTTYVFIPNWDISHPMYIDVENVEWIRHPKYYYQKPEKRGLRKHRETKSLSY